MRRAHWTSSLGLSLANEANFRGLKAKTDARSGLVRLVAPSLVAIALALRLTYYVLNPALSTDEASLALNLMHRSYSDLLDRLDFNQAGPPGFLLVQKVTIDVFGPSPYSLRLVPLLAGAAACLLMYRFSVDVAGRLTAIVALALFAVSDPLLSYASTSKQYSVDVAVTLALYATAFAIANRPDTRAIVFFAVIGIAAVFLSHPAAFVLAAIWAVLVAQNGIVRRWTQAAKLTGVAALWLASLALAYFLTHTSIEQIQRSAAVEGLPPRAALETLGGIVRYLLSVPAYAPEVRVAITCAAAAVCLVGVRTLSKVSLGLTAILIVPTLLAGVAVAIDLYPNFPRTFLFVVPSLIVLIAIGTVSLLSPRRTRIVRAGAGAAFLILLCVGASKTLGHLRPSTLTEDRSTLSYLLENARRGDSLYVSRSAQYTFRYYVECDCLAKSGVAAKVNELWPVRPTSGYGQFDAALESSPPSLIAGLMGSTNQDYARDFAPLLGRRRVWVLFVDPNPRGKESLITFLRNRGRLLEAVPGLDSNAVTSLFLYDLRPNRRPP
jgi:hypothetical protein